MPDELKVELIIDDDQAEIVLGKNRQKFKDYVNEIESKSPKLKFTVTADSYVDLDKLEKRAAETGKAFQNIAKTRLDGGQINNFTKEIVAAGERSRQLERDIAAIKREILSPNRKSSIAFLTEELRGAEREADALNRKLNSLPTSGGGSSPNSGGSSKTGGKAIPNLRGFGAVFREVGLTEIGINEGAINAATSLADVAKISAATLGIFGGIAVAGLAIVAVTKNIREEAERHLKIEEKIQSTVNNFILGRQKLLSDLKQARDDAGFNRDFSRFLDGSSEDVLKGKRAIAEKLLKLNPAIDASELLKLDPNSAGAKSLKEQAIQAERYSKEILDIDARLDAIKQQKAKTQDDAFNKHGDDLKKAEESSLDNQRKAAEKRIEAQKRFNESVEQGKTKAKELEKNYISAFDSLYEKSNADNPFAKIFTEADKQLRTLKENLRGLPQELQTTAIGLQNKINGDALFSAKLNNNLDIFDLRERANNFRNPFDPRKGLFNPAEPFAFPNSDFFTKGDEERKRILAKQNAPVSSFSPLAPDADTLKTLDGIRERARQDQIKLNEETIRSNDELAKKNQNDFINRRLERQVSIINADARSPEEKAIADRKLISLSSGLNPNDIKKDLRETIALANERDADRKEKAEADGRNLDRERNKILASLDENQKKLIKIAEKEGLAGIKNLIEIVDKTDGKVSVSTPNLDDVNGYFGFGFN